MVKAPPAERGRVGRLFENWVRKVSKLQSLSPEYLSIFEEADVATIEFVASEFEGYFDRKCNREIPRVLSRHNFLGVPLRENHGGVAVAIERSAG